MERSGTINAAASSTSILRFFPSPGYSKPTGGSVVESSCEVDLAANRLSTPAVDGLSDSIVVRTDQIGDDQSFTTKI